MSQPEFDLKSFKCEMSQLYYVTNMKPVRKVVVLRSCETTHSITANICTLRLVATCRESRIRLKAGLSKSTFTKINKYTYTYRFCKLCNVLLRIFRGTFNLVTERWINDHSLMLKIQTSLQPLPLTQFKLPSTLFQNILCLQKFKLFYLHFFILKHYPSTL